MKNILSSLIKEFIKVVIIVAIAVPTIALFAAWTGPTGAPPTNNADAPINVSDNSQEKKGDLSIHRAEGGYDVGLFTTDTFSVLGGAIFNNNSPTDDKKVIINADGNVGIGTVSPTAKLDVTGNLISRGTTLLARDGGNVGIRTVSPQARAPNNLSGNLDVNDVYLRSINQWVSLMNRGGGGGDIRFFCCGNGGGQLIGAPGQFKFCALTSVRFASPQNDCSVAPDNKGQWRLTTFGVAYCGAVCISN